MSRYKAFVHATRLSRDTAGGGRPWVETKVFPYEIEADSPVQARQQVRQRFLTEHHAQGQDDGWVPEQVEVAPMD